jgi:hypothetical protein
MVDAAVNLLLLEAVDVLLMATPMGCAAGDRKVIDL